MGFQGLQLVIKPLNPTEKKLYVVRFFRSGSGQGALPARPLLHSEEGLTTIGSLPLPTS